MKNKRRLLSLRDTWNKFKTGVSISPYSIYEVGLANQVNLAQLFTNTSFSGLSQYTYPQILQRYPYFEEKNNQWLQTARMTQLIESLWATYSESYCCFIDYDEKASSSEIDALEKDAVKKFYSTLFSILDDTWDKYDLMLSIYEDKKSHLLDAIKTMTSGDSSRTIEGETTGSKSGTTSGTSGSTTTTTFNTKDEDDGTESRSGTDTHQTTYNTSEGVVANEALSGDDELETLYNSQVANTSTHDTQVDATNKFKDTPQSVLSPADDSFNTNVTASSTTTDDDSTSTDVRSGKDTATTTYGKETDRTETRTKTGTETLLDTLADTLTIDKEHKKTGTEATTASGTTSGTDSETTSGTTSTTESGDTSSITTDERETLMARIDEIDNKYKMLVHEWAHEFHSLFWEVVDYEE